MRREASVLAAEAAPIVAATPSPLRRGRREKVRRIGFLPGLASNLTRRAKVPRRRARAAKMAAWAKAAAARAAEEVASNDAARKVDK